MSMDNFKIYSLEKKYEYLDRVISLIENSFQYSSKNSFAIDFAPLLSKRNLKNCYIIIDENTKKLAGHVGTLPRVIGNNISETKIVMIGGVAVDRNFRSLGLLKKLLTFIFSSEQNASLYLLWSDKNKLYEKFDFYEYGEIIQTNQRTFNPNDFPEFTCFKSSDLSLVEDLYMNNDLISIKRDTNDWKDLQKIRSINLYISNNKKEYFIMNKGQDLSGIIYEYSCSKKTLEKLSAYKLWSCRKNQDDLIFSKKSFSIFMSLIKIANQNSLENFFQDLNLTEGSLKDRLETIKDRFWISGLDSI